MRNPPSINSKAPTVRFFSRPLDSHVTGTHQRLSDVIEAMTHMILLRREQYIVDFMSLVTIRGCFQCIQVSSNVRQAVQLVEERDVVDLAFLCVLSRRQAVFFRVVDVDEAVSRLRM